MHRPAYIFLKKLYKQVGQVDIVGQQYINQRKGGERVVIILVFWKQKDERNQQ